MKDDIYAAMRVLNENKTVKIRLQKESSGNRCFHPDWNMPLDNYADIVLADKTHKNNRDYMGAMRSFLKSFPDIQMIGILALCIRSYNRM